MEKAFWNDVASKGAILGSLMLVSHIFEQAIMIKEGGARMGIVGVEMLVAFIIYIYLLYRFTKKHSMRYSAEEGFSYGKALGYVMLISLFASVIVGLGGYIFTHFVIGYDEYIKGMTEMYSEMLSSTPVSAQVASSYEQMLDQMLTQPEPSILAAISSSLWSYLLLGGFVGLIVAAVVKREPNIFENEGE